MHEKSEGEDTSIFKTINGSVEKSKNQKKEQPLEQLLEPAANRLAFTCERLDARRFD